MIDTYDKLTLDKWAQIAALHGRTFDDDLDVQVAVLAVLADKSEREILNLPVTEYAALTARAAFLLEEPKPSNITHRFKALKLEGWTLIPTTDLRKLTTAQYIDFQTLLQADATIEVLLSCFLVPEGKTYCDGYDVAELQRALASTLTVPDALALKAFFLRKFRRSMAAILTSCKWALIMAPRKVKREMRKALATTSPASGDGSTPSEP